MSRKPENVFIDSVHRHLPVELYRMKNHNEYNAGIADVWYDDKRDAWVEYKFLALPVRDTTVIDLAGGKNPPITHLQQQWLAARHSNGRSVGVIVGCKEGGVWFPGVSWCEPLTVADFRSKLLSRKELAKVIVDLVSK